MFCLLEYHTKIYTFTISYKTDMKVAEYLSNSCLAFFCSFQLLQLVEA